MARNGVQCRRRCLDVQCQPVDNVDDVVDVEEINHAAPPLPHTSETVAGSAIKMDRSRDIVSSASLLACFAWFSFCCPPFRLNFTFSYVAILELLTMPLAPSSSAPEPLHATTKTNVNAENVLHTTFAKLSVSHTHTDGEQRTHALTIPHVVLNVERISSAMAARLATSLLSHVLFLKSQIPL